MKLFILSLLLACCTTDLLAVDELQAPASDTLIYTAIIEGVPVGQRIAIKTTNSFHHIIPMGNRSFESFVNTDSKGFPTDIKITGFSTDGYPWDESFRVNNKWALWEHPGDADSIASTEDKFYVAIEKPYNQDIIFEALRISANNRIPLLPAGEATLEYIREQTVQSETDSKNVRLFAIHGLSLGPEFVWIDSKNRVFADHISIQQGWEDHFMELFQNIQHELSGYITQKLEPLIKTENTDRNLLIENAKIFDTVSKVLSKDTNIWIRDGRIESIESKIPEGFPKDFNKIDARGKTVLPGLWDMHVHVHPGKSDQVIAPLFIARGITTVRDLGGRDWLTSHIKGQSVVGKTIAPNILQSIILYGNPGPAIMGANIRTSDEATDIIRKYSRLGYVQAKIYNSVADSILPHIVREADRVGMRVSGHLPNGVSGREAIEAGFNEIQHLMYARVAISGEALTPSSWFDEDSITQIAEVSPANPDWDEWVALLRDNNIAIDATMVMEEAMGVLPFPFAEHIQYELPPHVSREMRFNRGPVIRPPLSEEAYREWMQNGPRILKALHDEGIPLIVGSDAFYGAFELARELELFVQAGIPEADVLSIATLGAAQIMDMDDNFGSIEPGKTADLILIEGNPLDNISDIRNISLVVKEGTLYDPDKILAAFGILSSNHHSP